MIYYLMGKSASGKDTVYKRLRERRPDWKRVVSYTTRPIRDGETEGEEYHFVSAEEMERFRKEGRIVELRRYETVLGPWEYATVEDGQIALGTENSYLMIGTLESYLKIRDYFGEENLYPLYIEVPNEIRLRRAEERERKQKVPRLEEMRRRFLADERDFSEEKLRQAGIGKRYQNLELESCLNEIIKDTGSKN